MIPMDTLLRLAEGCIQLSGIVLLVAADMPFSAALAAGWHPRPQKSRASTPAAATTTVTAEALPAEAIADQPSSCRLEGFELADVHPQSLLLKRAARMSLKEPPGQARTETPRQYQKGMAREPSEESPVVSPRQPPRESPASAAQSQAEAGRSQPAADEAPHSLKPAKAIKVKKDRHLVHEIADSHVPRTLPGKPPPISPTPQ